MADLQSELIESNSLSRTSRRTEWPPRKRSNAKAGPNMYPCPWWLSRFCRDPRPVGRQIWGHVANVPSPGVQRVELLSSTIAQTASLRGDAPPDSEERHRPRNQQQKEYEAKIADYEKRKADSKAKAEKLEAKRDYAGKVGAKLGLGLSCFSISIAMASICMMSKKKPLWFIAMALAAFGVAQMIMGKSLPMP